MEDAAAVAALRCPCGARAPEPLPVPGTDPVRCAQCATPLVAPGRNPASAWERGGGAALLTAVLLAAAWLGLARWTGTGAAWFIPVAALAIAAAACGAARRRALAVQVCAVAAVVVFLAVGEVLLYRHSMRQRLTAMHEAEGVHDAVIRADDELRDLDAWKYLGIEVDLPWFVATMAALWIAWRTARAPQAVAAFAEPASPPEPEPLG